MKIKLSFKLILALICVLALQTISGAQGMIRKIPLSQQIKKSSLVIEGKVIANKAIWNAKHNNIYTIHTVEVYKVFKGESKSTIEVITHGGTLDSTTQTVMPSLNLNINDLGVFTLYDNNISFSSEDSSAIKKFKPYSSLQGFYRYNLSENTAINPFVKKKNISSASLYNDIINLTKSTYKEIASFDIASKVSKANQNKDLLAPDAIVFTPTTVKAGNTTDLITITGTGFGSLNGKVGFADADFGGAIFVDALDSQVISWSPTEIKVRVPSLGILGTAGTGKIRVTVSGGASKVSDDELTISYALQNTVTSGEAFLRQHVSENMDGKITWRMNSSFDANTPAKEAFLRAFNVWRCATGINWVIGAVTSEDVVGADGINIISFDDNDPLDDGVLGVCSTWSGGCGAARHVVPQLDIVFNDDVDTNETGGIIETWNYGPEATTSDKYDFESVALHELGHGHQLGHVIDTDDVMHYSLVNGKDQRALSEDNKTAAGVIQGFSTASGLCGLLAMTNYSGSCDLNIQDNSFKSKISIYPNPAKHQFFIKNESFINLEKAVIYDISGRLISNHNFSSNSRTQTISLAGISKGIYFVNIHSKDTFITKTLILE